MNDAIAEIKSRLDIGDLVGERVELSNNKGFCPFHENSRTPAFAVFPTTQSWHCFGACNEGRDIFDYWQKLNGCDFVTALQELADKAGVMLDDSPEAKERRTKVLQRKQMYQQAADHYIKRLERNHQAQGYLRRRGLHRAIKSGLVGHADGSLDKQLANQSQLAVDNHLLSEGKYGLYDPLAGLVYICRDINGTPVDFESRSITEKKHRRLGPKYPFWALHNRKGQLIIVEGPADALTWWQMGFNALALNGVNLFGVQRADLNRFETLYYVLDRDKTGTETLAKTAVELGGLTNIVAIYRLKGVKDANDMLQAGAQPRHFQHILNLSKPWLDIFIQGVKGFSGTKFDGAIMEIMQIVIQLPQASQIRYKEVIVK